MKPHFFLLVIFLLLSFSTKAQALFEFKEHEWVKIETCKQCQSCSGQISDKEEIQKNIDFYCDEKITDIWTVHKISLPACDSTYYRISNSDGKTFEFANEDDALKNICKHAVSVCPNALPPRSMTKKEAYGPKLMTYLIAEYVNALSSQDGSKAIDRRLLEEVDVKPRFPGCEHLNISEEQKMRCAESKLLEYIGSNVRYPLSARKKGIEGKVVIYFVIDKDGTVTDEAILRDIGGGCGAEALRLVRAMRENGVKWTPGIYQGQPVRVFFHLPVAFKLK